MPKPRAGANASAVEQTQSAGTVEQRAVGVWRNVLADLDRTMYMVIAAEKECRDEWRAMDPRWRDLMAYRDATHADLRTAIGSLEAAEAVRAAAYEARRTAREAVLAKKPSAKRSYAAHLKAHQDSLVALRKARAGVKRAKEAYLRARALFEACNQRYWAAHHTADRIQRLRADLIQARETVRRRGI